MNNESEIGIVLTALLLSMAFGFELVTARGNQKESPGQRLPVRPDSQAHGLNTKDLPFRFGFNPPEPRRDIPDRMAGKSNEERASYILALKAMESESFRDQLLGIYKKIQGFEAQRAKNPKFVIPNLGMNIDNVVRAVGYYNEMLRENEALKAKEANPRTEL